MTDDDIMTAQEVADWLKVSDSWVRDHALGRRQPRIPSIRVGTRRGLLRFRRSEIEIFLQDNSRNGAR